MLHRCLAPPVVVCVVLCVVVCVVVCLVSCGDKKTKAPVSNDETPALRDAASEPIPAKPAPPVYTAEQKKRYRSHLAAGRKLSEARKWGEAARRFEKALAVIPMDGRALSELGWAAFQAGDYDLARSANRDSVRAATDPNVRAASLYNLGRVAEAVGNKDEAARHYRESLELRRNRTVEKRLAGLAESVPRAGSVGYQRCGPSAEVDALCECVLSKTGPVDNDDDLSCHREPRRVPGIELLFIGDEVEEWVHLIARGKDGWSSVAALGYVYNPEAFGIHEELEIARLEIRPVGERNALWVETVQTRTDRDDVRDAVESSEVRTLTLCSWPSAQDPLTCALQLPLYERYERKSTGNPAPETTKAPERISTIRRLDIEVRENGTAKVVLLEGEKTDAVAPLLGEHTLW